MTLSTITCSALVQAWQLSSTEAAELSPATLQRYQGSLLAFLHWFEREQQRPLQLLDLNPITLVGYRTQLQTTAATSTVNTHLCALRSWCSWLVQQHYLTVNPALRLKLIGQTKPLAPKALTAAQLNLLLRQVSHTRYPVRNTAIIQMLVQTGLRIGECACLHFEDISFGERQGQVLVRAGKGNQARAVPLNASVRQALADYVAPQFQLKNTLKAVATDWPKPGTGETVRPLWQSERGKALSLREMNRIIHLLLEECANLKLLPPGFTAHSLRHTFATAYLRRHPADLVGLARLLGHRSLDTTRIYVEPTAAELTARLDALDLNIYAN
jgi:site-specific recombinase XerD